ncbi:MAG: cytochrome c [Thermoleophilia bacterium]
MGAVVAVTSGCGNQSGDTANGKKLFQNTCGGCHTLADAGTKGQIGPNLDDAWRGSRDTGIPDSQYQGVVNRWIQWAQKPMPRHLLKGQDAADVAAYVASVAGTSDNSAVIPAKPQIPQATPVHFVQD